MNKFLKIMYLKYVIGHCRHFCFLCKFKKNKCWEEMWEDIKTCDWKSLFRYKAIKDKVNMSVEVEEDKIEEAKNILHAKLDCMYTCGLFNCDKKECDSCYLMYAQGTLGEQKEALELAFKALVQLQKGV